LICGEVKTFQTLSSFPEIAVVAKDDVDHIVGDFVCDSFSVVTILSFLNLRNCII
jgi:hypothetical protein